MRRTRESPPAVARELLVRGQVPHRTEPFPWQIEMMKLREERVEKSKLTQGSRYNHQSLDQLEKQSERAHILRIYKVCRISNFRVRERVSSSQVVPLVNDPMYT